VRERKKESRERLPQSFLLAKTNKEIPRRGKKEVSHDDKKLE